MTPLGYRRLILTRHAKSAWDDPTLEDFDRPLNARGRRAAVLLGDFMASRGYEPEEVLCSPAQRTRETWERVASAGLEVRPAIRFEDRLFHARPADMLEVLKTATQQTVMMIGHNPGIAEFAESLPARPPMDPDFRRFPTAATLVVDFQIESWSEVKPGTGSLMDFVRIDGRD
ncbi:SixA phosphatase family protein [Paracoccus sediminicola]|uniref:SixA phosphatase family protein n=1 Tax=Paracoccus sediminicola TaxID=3017783 RepID=UPI0022F10F90|nr:histidine phosphatase family protein [Paracoccus sediminicola]WBU55750.1 histidine phosphatase family protein [Paracoccus sediminicola]